MGRLQFLQWRVYEYLEVALAIYNMFLYYELGMASTPFNSRGSLVVPIVRFRLEGIRIEVINIDFVIGLVVGNFINLLNYIFRTSMGRDYSCIKA